eukprot:CAMPEP_0114367024 /NCGR_PEP_ID=MMETSP0101-20121206/29774_1 /TAXON_ID=38822 ORGANISM="Pteridomonas danica, Strain PT" /NCGR_SAMPLE_ID=MMETSP0101 /ASSEMBLY_ACC=CAM_ASM_000211 /LENGTH=38 /DNA_ID= /DNA_START= /DNA_END= /DNA_ORIENTATION=
MKVNGKIMKNMVKDQNYQLMGVYIKVDLYMIKNMVQDY